MHNKVAGSWNSAHDTEYLAMAEDGVEEGSCRNISTIVSDNNTDNIVCNVFRKASNLTDERCLGAVAEGLENTIQEMRTGVESLEFKKCLSPADNDQDSPIDFSVKRRTSFSGSLSDDSQTSSSSPGHMTDYSVMSPSVESGCGNNSLRFSKRDSPSPDGLSQRHHNQIKTGASPNTLSPALNNFAFLSGITPNLLVNSSAMNCSLAQIAAGLREQRATKSNRPFKSYPKEALQMPLGFFGIPGLTSTALQQNIDLGMFMGINGEDLVNLYHQQVHLVRDSKFSSRTTKVSTPTSSKQIHHHHYQHQSHYHNPNSQATTASSISPSLVTSDHLKTGTTTVHSSNVLGSLNATLVSSTSSSFAVGNSRKRPSSLPDAQKDAAYWERRRKNNDAAKRSRDARRAKEDEIAMRAALLEQENLKLRVEVAALKTETERLRCMLYSN